MRCGVSLCLLLDGFRVEGLNLLKGVKKGLDGFRV